MKKTNVLNHSSKNWLFAFVAVCGFMFLGASGVSAQDYVSNGEAEVLIKQLLLQDEKAELEGRSTEQFKIVTNASQTAEDVVAYVRPQVLANFHSSLSTSSVSAIITQLRNQSQGLGGVKGEAMISIVDELDTLMQK